MVHIENDDAFTAPATRGNGSVGEDITANVARISDVPNRINTDVEVEVRGEVYLPLSVFESMKGDFANPRNTAAGALKQKDSDNRDGAAAGCGRETPCSLHTHTVDPNSQSTGKAPGLS